MIGSIHFYEHEKIKTTIFGFDVQTTFYEEIRTYSFIRYINIDLPATATSEEVKDYVVKKSHALYSKFVLMQVGIMLRDSGLPAWIDTIPAGPVGFTTPSGNTTDILVISCVFLLLTAILKVPNALGAVRGDGSGGSVEYTRFFQNAGDTNHGKCSLLRNITSPYRVRFLYAKDNENFGTLLIFIFVFITD